MNADLETLVRADEEARARVDSAREDTRRLLAAARSRRDAVLRERKLQAEAELAREIEAIREEGARLVEERRRARAQVILARRAETEPLLERAAGAYAAILIEGPPRREN